MDYLALFALIVVGIVTGFINTVAGGGSLISLPILIFMGLPPAVANGTNRVAVFVQCFTGMLGFRSKGISSYPYSIYLGISALFGALIGAKISVELDDALFNKVIAIVMVLVVLVTIFKPFQQPGDGQPKMGKKNQATGIVLFFLVGIYGGFIQAGVGFLIIATLSAVNRLSFVKINSIKLDVVFIYTIAALALFIIEGAIHWEYGVVLALGNAAGAWVASRWSVNKGDRWLKWFMIIMVIALAIKLWFFDQSA